MILNEKRRNVLVKRSAEYVNQEEESPVRGSLPLCVAVHGRSLLSGRILSEIKS